MDGTKKVFAMSGGGTDVAPRIFLDYQSTTPVDPRVLSAMLPYFSEQFGNPHSVEHSYGIQAKQAIDAALASIADVIGASTGDIVITSGATEANNLALRGSLPAEKKSHLISAVTEHQSVLGTLAALKQDGHAITLVEVDGDGLIDPESVQAAIRPTTRIVSIMAVNSEIGVVQPYAELGQLCRSHKVLFHVDAAQGFGRVPLDVRRNCIDLMSVSAHKIYGPKGVGALYVGAEVRSRMRAQITGGGQQRGLRAGTLPTPLVVGFGEAARLMKKEVATEAVRLVDLRTRLWNQLVERVGGVHQNGSTEHRWVGNLNVRFNDVDADSLLLMVPQLAISTGTACTAGTPEPSRVLRAMGLTLEQASQSLRIGLGRMTTAEEVDRAATLIANAVDRLRS